MTTIQYMASILSAVYCLQYSCFPNLPSFHPVLRSLGEGGYSIIPFILFCLLTPVSCILLWLAFPCPFEWDTPTVFWPENLSEIEEA